LAGRGGTLRQQHDPRRPIGKGVEIGPDGLTVKSVVIAKGARKLTLARVLRSYSVGIAYPTIVRDPSAPAGKIVNGSIIELSLCDTPSNASCGIQLVKAAPDGCPVYVGKAWGAPAVAKGGRVGACMVCGHSLKGHHRYCHGCGEKSPLFDEEAAMAKQKATKSYRNSILKTRRLPGWVDAVGTILSEADVTADLIASLNSTSPDIRLGAEQALRERLR